MLFIKKISSDIINYNWSYLFIKLFNYSKFKERLEWIVIQSILNVVFPIYAMNNVLFFNKFNWVCLL
jgi:hypothetical protein